MSNLTGQRGEVHMTLQITRAATSKTETVELVGTIAEQPQDDPEPQSADAPKED
jgi:hypothetical protein